ncbi:MAG: phosphoribosylamine--glycine ligase, partial [Candidatus Nanoarchaeia archaeon]
MKVMIIGNGGREHALGWNISKSDEVSEVIYAPGNAGTAEGKGRNVDIDPMDFPGLISFIESENLDLTVVGPEAPLAKGLVDLLHARGYQHVFGCTRKAAMLESDKFFSYDLMRSLDIPQAESIKCYTLEEAFAAIRKLATNQGVVIQARGLTGGKGVTVCESKTEALEEIVRHTEKYGTEVLIAERLSGQEFSVFGISDGNQVLPLEISLQDHKPVFDGDKGPNTGGMGAYGPASVASRIVVKEVSDGIMNPLVRKMRYARNPFVGFLYAGMIMTSEGPKVIEFNVRFGDPECQPAMMMVD